MKILKKKGGVVEKREEETKSMPHAPVAKRNNYTAICCNIVTSENIKWLFIIVLSFQKQKRDSTKWWCSVRNQTTKCSATVLQKGSNFRAGRNQHCHTADPGTVVGVKITTQVYP